MNNAHPYFKNRIESWLQSLQSFDKFFILDLLYIEHRLGYTMGPAMYGLERRVDFAFYAMNHHELFEIMLSLPHTFRFNNGLYRKILQTAAPELLFFPLQNTRYTGWDKYSKAIESKFSISRNLPPNVDMVFAMLNHNQGFMEMIYNDIKSFLVKIPRLAKSILK
ncbi:hypothetical protein FJR11_02140 [Anabaena sp. UHCC 0187]|uniref:hypothetical protein n=1 Tax=Anabaena sp. UHCC 0187 TaxID=2590018 RepID=UPI001448884A|nr:hypothetical protein [Anabaena sp. UHCC 0187]MTJ11416.1 hypothetical protein [Anabaena sp. UHCC 0187]